MATFIEIRTDGFAENMKRIKNYAGAHYEGVRRPFRGIEIKEDTYGVIKVMKANGDELPLVDAGGPYAPGQTNRTGSGTKSQDERSSMTTTYNYSNFIIQQVQDSREEKQQILETFGDSYIFFFGERPRILLVNGLLMNTVDFNWRTEFWHNYENTLRGTKLVEQGARVYLYWDDIVVEGYMIGATARDDASSPYHIPFSFHLFVTNHMYLSAVGDDDYPITHAVDLDSILRDPDVTGAREQLQAEIRETSDYIRTIEATKQIKEASERPVEGGEGLEGFLNSSAGKGLMATKNVMATALSMGINAQNLTFLSIVNRLFRQRKLKLPIGKRTLPYRSKIRDNVDEYIGTVDTGDPALGESIIESQALPSKYEMEKLALSDLDEAGINVIKHPGGSPFDRDHTMGSFAGVASEAALLATGFTVAATRQRLGAFE